MLSRLLADLTGALSAELESVSIILTRASPGHSAESAPMRGVCGGGRGQILKGLQIDAEKLLTSLNRYLPSFLSYREKTGRGAESALTSAGEG